MRLRPAGPGDVAAVTALEATIFAGDAWSEPLVREELTGAGRRVVVADDGGVVGYAVTLRAGDVVDLQRIAVVPALRRGGLARRMLEHLLATAVEDGGRRMLLEVAEGNEAARAFYAAEGFEEIARRRRYYRDGSDAVVMQRSLAP